ncbi:MAG: AIPR family protein [Solidesulfovibrio sp.]|uniref:AIPR family protein n=1 Tax=Solidesulfovibrio sp. TaxID=2910990 RepID=UPI003158AD9F
MGFAEVLQGRADLERYGNNALLLFALELKYGIEDIHTVAVESLTDGPDDKKCDLIYIDIDSQRAVVAQSYFSKTSKSQAPANKASDLNTAAAWLLSSELHNIPSKLLPAITKLRDSIESGLITDVVFWYVHNCNESVGVEAELNAVSATVHSALKTYFSAYEREVQVTVKEVGVETLDSWYHSQSMAILVTEPFGFHVVDGYEIVGEKWRAFITSVSGQWLYNIFLQHQDDIFSANIRGYLGSRKSDQNINNGIKETAANSPDLFCVYNNGLTILTNAFSYDESTKQLQIEGISIVNGAQTTGALGSLGREPSSDLKVQCRFVCCSDQEIIKNIIFFNNSQNKIEASDFRSNDVTQKRLRTEFCQIPNITYLGGRRGGFEDKIKRPVNLLPSDTAGQVLAAFHGDPVIAYNEKSNIWENNAVYSLYFSEKTTAQHILFCYSLLKCILEVKLDVQAKSQDSMTENDVVYLSFFRNRGSHFLLLTAISGCMEIILNKPIPDKFKLFFTDGTALESAVAIWRSIVDAALAFVQTLMESNALKLKNKDDVSSAVTTFKQLMTATKAANTEIYARFALQLVKN